MAQIWDYIAQYNPTGFYEDNRSKTLDNDLTSIKISAANRENARQQKIMDLQDAWNNGDTEALRSLGIYAPEVKKQYIENEQEMLDTTRPWAQTILQMAPEKREEGYQQMRRALKNIDFSDAPVNYDETFITTLANSDPKKIEKEREYALREQELQRNQAREYAKLRFAKQLQEEELQKQLARIQAGVSAGDITPEEGQVVVNELKYGVTPKGMVDRLQAEYFNQNTTPERRQEIIQEVEAWKNATKTSGSSAKGVESNKEYDKWLEENPDATEEEKRDKRFGLKIETGSDKIWLEKEKQRVKDGSDFLVDSGIAENTEQANQLLGVGKNSPVGKALSKETIDFLNNPLMANKDYKKAAMTAKGKDDFEQAKNEKYLIAQKTELLPKLLDGLAAAEDGEGLGFSKGWATRKVGSERGTQNVAKINNLSKALSPTVMGKLKAAGAGSKSFESEGERKAYGPDFSITDDPKQTLSNILEFSDKMLDIDLREAQKLIKEGKSMDEVINTIIKKQSNPQKVFTVEEYFGEQ